MPVIDGFEVVRRLRADPRTAHLPVLHVSASFTDPDEPGGGPRGRRRRIPHPPGRAGRAPRQRPRPAARALRRAGGEGRGSGVAGDLRGDRRRVCVVDSAGRIQRHNAALESIVGRQALDGLPLAELMPVLAGNREPPFLTAADGQALVGTELTFDGRRLLVSCRAMPDADGSVRQAVVRDDGCHPPPSGRSAPAAGPTAGGGGSARRRHRARDQQHDDGGAGPGRVHGRSGELSAAPPPRHGRDLEGGQSCRGDGAPAARLHPPAGAPPEAARPQHHAGRAWAV